MDRKSGSWRKKHEEVWFNLNFDEQVKVFPGAGNSINGT